MKFTTVVPVAIQAYCSVKNGKTIKESANKKPNFSSVYFLLMRYISIPVAKCIAKRIRNGAQGIAEYNV